MALYGFSKKVLSSSIAFVVIASNLVDASLPDPIKKNDFIKNGEFDENKAELGRLLFFDKILSGNKNISCATCHHPLAGTGDGLSLSVGQGGEGLSTARNTGLGESAIRERVPRNAPPVFSLGAKSVTTIFHDGRIEVDPSQPSGFLNPAGDSLPSGLDSILAVQAMFPVTSAAEMAGHEGDNPIADAAAIGNLAGPDGVWALIAQRVREIPAYAEKFQDAFGVFPDDIEYVHIANAIAEFEASEWMADNTPFDQFLRRRGDRSCVSSPAPLYRPASWGGFANGLLSSNFYSLQQTQIFNFFSPVPSFNSYFGVPYKSTFRVQKRCESTPEGLSASQIKGMELFYGKANCVSCHSGKLMSDMAFHAIAMPQIGPGKGDGFDGLEDFGRERVTGDTADRYKFRTPILRNVALTGPWGHAGAYNSLESVVRHHLNPVDAIENYDCSEALLTPDERFLEEDCSIQDNPFLVYDIANASEIAEVQLTDKEVGFLVDFLYGLTDPKSLDQRSGVPFNVPSGLPVAD